MPFYDFKCPKCHIIETIMLSMSAIGTHVAKCNRHIGFFLMERNYQSEQINTNMDSAKPHISNSLAIHPDQTAEHKQIYPDVGVLPDGRIQFDSPKIHDNYLKKRGMFKHPQKKRLLTAK